MLQLLEKIPFSDPSLLPPTYRMFGKQVYDLLHEFDVTGDDGHEDSDSEYVAENIHTKCTLIQTHVKHV